ncbi:proteasome assembly chaperone family protein [Haloarchaeobius sp. FL176]|uniref:proteasome assembly chaperone family protein n=1 Tax=Haloarchaeobius sp. FL176 TaxID=2967129 RepID=UPI0021478C55|nr:PAC2 family protein [Haloarchaeobius sp. FL176]
MATQTIDDVRFDVSHDEPVSDVVVAGFSQFGLAGLTAVDYLVEQLELEQTGHIVAQDLPSITPFDDGVPRHSTRLLSRDDLNLTVLMSELFVPVWAAKPFARAVLDWTETNAVEEVAILSGVPVPHGPEDHRTFYVATEDYRSGRLEGSEVSPMPNGFLDGVNAALVERGMTSSLAVGVYATPVHAQAPDVDAALNLLDAVGAVYDLDLETGPLEEFAERVAQYYAELAERLEAVPERDTPDDRMYM